MWGVCVAALVLDAAAAASVGNLPVQMPPYAAAPRGDNADQLRLTPYGGLANILVSMPHNRVSRSGRGRYDSILSPGSESPSRPGALFSPARRYR